ncbi:hypothetical protein L1987_04086 [Smallanthus sonchifolius]|uniref:Uncharacterized protein n=1 Tax=Smallanthus sonchifolius TaxID=185202 RepID=A0ACB9KCH4_9ASTR|nr:hypothetical protein L1987_04086 [Smallanthus sonchifolius]
MNIKKFGPFLDLCVSSLRRGHANLLCIVPILSDVPEGTMIVIEFGHFKQLYVHLLSDVGFPRRQQANPHILSDVPEGTMLWIGFRLFKQLCVHLLVDVGRAAFNDSLF